MDQTLEAVTQGLFIGQQITRGSQQYQIENAKRRLRNLATGKFASLSDVLDADVQKRLAEREAILKGLASALTVLLSANLKDLTGKQYATLSQLAAMGHPYAKRHFKDARGRYNPRLKAGRAGLPTPPFAVNDQTGFLSSGFEYEVVQKPGGMFAVLATNPALYSGILSEGSGTMIGRAYDQQAARLAQQGMGDAVRTATKRLEAIGEAVPNLKAPEVDFALGGVHHSFTAK